MKHSKVKKELKTRSGVVIREGESVTLESLDGNDRFLRARTSDGRCIITRAVGANEKFTGIMKYPSIKTIEKWVNDESCTKAIDGCCVEPDGICSHGMPSWLIVLGMI